MKVNLSLSNKENAILEMPAPSWLVETSNIAGSAGGKQKKKGTQYCIPNIFHEMHPAMPAAKFC